MNNLSPQIEDRVWLTAKESKRLKNKLRCVCGSDMLCFTISPTGYGDYRHQVTCSSCGARGGKATNKDQAIKEWER